MHTTTNEQMAADELFRRTSASPSRMAQQRREAAAALARTQAGEAWTIVILTHQECLGDWIDPKLPDEIRQDREQAPRAIVAALLENIPSKAGNAVLWAVTCKLSDVGIGTYGVREGFPPFVRHTEYGTKPMRDIARETLARALGEDYGYDSCAWREAILRRSGAPGAP
jgi:hypothetical protein